MFPASDGVRDYRRTLFQIDLGPDAAYWVDLFDINGGYVHDYSLHARPLGAEGTFALDGVTPQPVPYVWTLAGLDPKWRGASFSNLAVLPHIIPGHKVADVVAIMGSVDPVFGEVDR